MLKLRMIFNYVLILTHYVKTFGFIITKQAGEIALTYVNGNILKVILKLLISFVKF